MKPLEPRGPVEIWNITSTTQDGLAIVGFSFHGDRSTWIHSRQSAPEIIDTYKHEENHHLDPGCNEREILAFTEADMAVIGLTEVIRVIEILENAKGWWRIRRKMGNYALQCWGLER